MTPVRVVLVDDQLLIRQGLRKLLEIEEGIEVVGEAADGPEALRVVGDRRPHVALVDMRMPGMNGVELVVRMAAEHPQVAVIVLSTFDEDEYVVGALRGGAAGYLLKDCSPDELVAAVHRVRRGETVLGGPAAARLVAGLRRTSPERAEPPGWELLSAREQEVARMVAAGAVNREIAARLFITEGTVKNHVSSVLRKLGLRDRVQLTVRVHSARWP
ncbi:DNA-binding response regulator [Sphaerisporangium rufum]|uniref:DNA-binding response regulator n=1 Tax=Sphaerisporangium rufum TaxID=1381558 RepID=A0A919R850_9ACTN|nr:response regulator transcription factor [Sphaerisporangium rufum]GII79960.1 DNA-binding response regulator [Sphaerisporangium rufum]